VRSETITAITAEGVKLCDDSIVPVDALICATGFDTTFRPAFPVIGYEKDLRELWKSEPRSYCSLAAPGIPNYFSKCF
jgi:cation diffusion facilitator CzcD-associated flavoprotein CzcO